MQPPADAETFPLFGIHADSDDGNLVNSGCSSWFFPEENGVVRVIGSLSEGIRPDFQRQSSRKTASRGLPESGQVPNLPFEEDNATENLCAIFCFRPTWTPSNLTKPT